MEWIPLYCHFSPYCARLECSLERADTTISEMLVCLPTEEDIPNPTWLEGARQAALRECFPELLKHAQYEIVKREMAQAYLDRQAYIAEQRRKKARKIRRPHKASATPKKESEPTPVVTDEELLALLKAEMLI